MGFLGLREGGKAIINQSTSYTYLFTDNSEVVGRMTVMMDSMLDTFLHKKNFNSLHSLHVDITATIKCEKTYEICEGCSQKIHDRYYLRVAETNWHEACLTCNICHLLLNFKCYVRNSKLYCKDDYYR